MSDLDATRFRVTPEWLTEVLSRKGILRGGVVMGLNIANAFETPPSLVIQIAATYSHRLAPPPPGRLFLKLPKPGRIEKLRREVDFYTRIGPVTGDLPIVVCFDACYSGEPTGTYLLLADVSNTHSALRGSPPSVAQAASVVDALARLHAAWWDRDGLSEAAGPNTEESFAAEFARHERCYGQLVDILGDELPQQSRRIFGDFLAFAPALLLRRASEGRAMTLCHPDSHGGNFLVPHDLDAHQTYIIDWHGYRPFWGPSDLVFFITDAWEPSQRRAYETDLLRRYHDCLRELGVPNYSWDDCRHDYRLAAIDHLRRPLGLRTFPDVQHYVNAAVTTFQDWDCQELLTA